MPDSALAKPSQRQSVAAHHRIVMRRTAPPGLLRPAPLTPLLVYLLIIAILSPSTATRQTEQYIVCKDIKTDVCLTWLVDYEDALQLTRKMYPDIDYTRQCGFSDLRVISPHQKFITVTPFDEEPANIIFCKIAKMIVKDSSEWISAKSLNSAHRLRRQAPYSLRGRYRGQTQSQYLAIDHGNGKDEGKAEAHSAADSSRASVSGSSGMGQAQSQTMYDPSCDDCVGRGDSQAESLKRRPFDAHSGGSSGGIPIGGSNNIPGNGPYGIGNDVRPGPNGNYAPGPNGGSTVYGPNGNGHAGFGPTQHGGAAFEPQTGVGSGTPGSQGINQNLPSKTGVYGPSHGIGNGGGPGGYLTNQNGGYGGGQPGVSGTFGGNQGLPSENAVPGGLPPGSTGYSPHQAGTSAYPSTQSGVPHGTGNGNLQGGSPGGSSYGPSQGGGYSPPNQLLMPGTGSGTYGPGQHGLPGGSEVYGPNQSGTEGKRPYGPSQNGLQSGAGGGPYGSSQNGLSGGTVSGPYGSNQNGLPGGTGSGTYGPNQNGLQGGTGSGPYGPNQIGGTGVYNPSQGGVSPGGFSPGLQGSPPGQTTSNRPYGSTNWPSTKVFSSPDGTTFYCCVAGPNNNPQYFKLDGNGLPTGTQTGAGPYVAGPSGSNGPYPTYGTGPGNTYTSPYNTGTGRGPEGLPQPSGQYNPSTGGGQPGRGSTGGTGPYGFGPSGGQSGISVPGGIGVIQDPGNLQGPANLQGQGGLQSPGQNGLQGMGGIYGQGGLSGPGGVQGQGSGPGSGGAPGSSGIYGQGGLPGSGGLPGQGSLPGSNGAPGSGGIYGQSGLPGPGGLQGQGSLPGSSGAPGSGGIYGQGGLPGAGGLQGQASGPGSSGAPGSGGIYGQGGLPGPGGVPGQGSVPGSSGAPGSGGVYGQGGLPGPGSLQGQGSLPGSSAAPGSGGIYGHGGLPGQGGLSGPGSLQGSGSGPGSSNLPGPGSMHGQGFQGPGGLQRPGGLQGQDNLQGPGALMSPGSPLGLGAQQPSGGQQGAGVIQGPGGHYGSLSPGGQNGLQRPGEQTSLQGPHGQYGPGTVNGANGLQGPGGSYGSVPHTGQSNPPGTNALYGPGSSGGQGGLPNQYIPGTVGQNGYGPPSGTYGTYAPGTTGGQNIQHPYGTGSTGGQNIGSGNIGPYGQGPPGDLSGQTGIPNQYGTGQGAYGPQYGNGMTGTGQFDNGRYGYNGNGNTDQNGDYAGIPQNVVDPNSIGGAVDGDDSEAEASVSQAANGTVATASSKGGNDKGRAQTHVHGAYTGGGSFSAQAEISGENKAANSEVTGDKKGASSNAQGSGRNNKSQANVQLGSETGSVLTGSQSQGTMHSSNTQVQGSVKGGMADAQARGPGSTSSQAQIGFTPYKDGDKAHELQKIPFVGGGTAAAQSSGRTGSSQSLLRGTFKYGITYNGGAQAGASLDKDTVFSNRLPFDKIDVYDESNKNINVNSESPEGSTESVTESYPYSESPLVTENIPLTQPDPISSTEFDIKSSTERTDELTRESETEYGIHTHSDHHKSDIPPQVPVPTRTPPAESRRSFPSTYSTNSGDYEYTTDKDENTPDDYDVDDGFGPEGGDATDVEQGEYSTYNEFSRDTEQTHQSLHGPRRKGLEVRQTSGGNTQHIVLGSLNNHDAEITQRNSERPDESKVYLPGERVPGTGGYTIPVGFTGSVKSVASKDKTYVVGSKDSSSQAQTVSLTPGQGKVKYTYPASYARNINPKNLRSLYQPKPDDSNRYVSVSKSVTRDLDAENNIRKQYSHTYYTKSSSCGYFTFTCTMVTGAEGRKKVCKPKIPTNPDGTPMRC